MKDIIKKLANLINVKSIVTILVTIIFMVLSVNGTLTGEQFISIFTVIIAFYFGTQKEKNDNNNNKTE